LTYTPYTGPDYTNPDHEKYFAWLLNISPYQKGYNDGRREKFKRKQVELIGKEVT